MEFTIKDIIAMLVKRSILIAACTFISLFLFFFVSKFIIRPSYTATVQMYVDPKESTSGADLTELNYAQKVVTTYINFLQTKVFYRQVIKESGLEYTMDELREMTVIQSVDNTEIFQISVTALNPQDSFKLVETMQDIAPVHIKSIKDTAEISVVDPVIVPEAPSSPNIFMNTALGGILGFLFSVLAFFLWEIIDVNVKNQDDLIKKYQIPILGSIPNFDVYDRKLNKLINKLPSHSKDKNKTKVERKINTDTEFYITEAYKSLRTNLRFTLNPNKCKKIIICSPVPEDGKSTTSTNIGITIAQTGAKVLLMDCDLRKGRLHNFFNLKSSPGVSDVLSGMAAAKDVIWNTSYENLYVMSLGSLAPNPTELLASNCMEELLKELEVKYDYIIFDTPPVNVVSDSLSLVKLVDGVVIVVREGITSHPNIFKAVEKFKFIEANILGFVLNGVSRNQGDRSKPHYYYY